MQVTSNPERLCFYTCMAGEPDILVLSLAMG